MQITMVVSLVPLYTKSGYLVVTEYVIVFLKSVPGRNINAIDILVPNLSRIL